MFPQGYHLCPGDAAREDIAADNQAVVGELGGAPDTGSVGLRSARARANQAQDVINQLAGSLFEVGVLLKAAAGLPGDAARVHIGEALSRLDDAVQAALDHVSAEHSREVESSLACSPLEVPGRLRWSADRAGLLRERLAQTVRALHRSALEMAGVLERRIEVVREPGRIDYRTELKRWRGFAEQAEQMARRLERKP